MSDFNWNAPGVTDQLKALWAEGYSASQIARVLGGDSGLPTRNAVIGRVNRLKLFRDPTGPRPVIALPEPPAAPPPEPKPVYTGPTIAPRDLEHWHCKFPLGDPQDATFGHCGAPREPGRPYCAAHVAVSYQPIKQNAIVYLTTRTDSPAPILA